MTPLFDIDKEPASGESCVMAIGVFDGVHRGHTKLLCEAAKLAGKYGAKLFILTFHPHPDRVLRGGDSATKLIYPLEIRAEILADREHFLIPEGCDADRVFVKKFTKEFASESPQTFLESLKQKFPRLKALVTGENFKFGKDAAADTAWLKKHAGDFGLETLSVSGVKEDGRLVSSTRLREALLAGDMYEFSVLAGRPYFAQGRVSEGKHLGGKLGFPTLNLKWSQECVPPFGVYAAGLVNLDTQEAYAGVANYGTNPTVEESDPVIETSLFDAPDFGPGANIRVEFFEFIRPEMKFDSLEELKKQIQKDKDIAKDLWKSGFGQA